MSSLQSRRSREFGGLSQSSKTPSWIMKHYKWVDNLSKLRMSSPLHKCEALLLKTFWRQYWFTGGATHLRTFKGTEANFIYNMAKWPAVAYPAVGHGQAGGIECSDSWPYFGITEMSTCHGQRKPLLEMWHWGGMPPDTPRLHLPLWPSLFHITNNLMTLLKNIWTHHWVGSRKSASNRALRLLRLTLRMWMFILSKKKKTPRKKQKKQQPTENQKNTKYKNVR